MDEDISQELQQDFVTYVLEETKALKELLNADEPNEDQQYQVLLKLHNIKGSASTFGYDYLGKVCHRLESLVHGDGFQYLSSLNDLRKEINNFPNFLKIEKNEENDGIIQSTDRLSTLLYVSKRCDGIESNIEEILNESLRNNATRGITGVLLFNGQYFVQVLEGERKSLNSLYTKILSDPRHQDIVLQQFIETSARSYSSWNMAYVPDNQAARVILKNITGNDTFDPYHYTSKVLVQIMRTLVALLPK